MAAEDTAPTRQADAPGTAPERHASVSPNQDHASEYARIASAQARAVAAGDPAGDELLRFIEEIYEWPEWEGQPARE